MLRPIARRLFRLAERASNMKLQGPIHVIPTPLADDDSVDVDAVRRIVGRSIETGSTALWVLGSAGEQPFLTAGQRRIMVETAADEAGGRVPVIAGVMDCSTRRALDNMRAVKAAGADATTALPPYYFPLQQEQILSFYMSLAEEGPLPLVLYNNPTICITNMSPETVGRLARLPNIVAIKESSGDLRRFQQMRYAVDENAGFSMLAGSDQLAHASLLVGGEGTICGLGCVAPDLYAGICRSARDGDLAAGREYQRKLVALVRVIFGYGPESSAALIKYALSLLGLCSPRVCAPLAGPSEAMMSRVKEVLQEVGAS